MTPLFVTVEGIEASGKSTLAAGLAERLRADGCDPLVTREPGGTPVGDAIRAIFLQPSIAITPLAEALLVCAARTQHVRDVIRPALGAGRIVVCDRFTDSTLAYQGYGRGVDAAFLRELCGVATEGLEPDLTLIVDVPVELSRARTRTRGNTPDRLEREDDRFHERVRDGFLQLARLPHRHLLDGRLAPEPLLAAALAVVRDRSSATVP